MTYTAEFSAQAWVNDTAIDVDPEGETTWDATAFVEAYLEEQPTEAALWLAHTLEHSDHDDILRNDENAPEWVRNWHGPFDTYLTESE